MLTAAPGAVNAGIILLEAVDSYWGSFLAAPDSMLNTSTGLIAVLGGAGARGFSGELVNTGTIFVATDTQLLISSESADGPTLVQAGGVIAAAGELTMQGGLLDFESGDLLGLFYAKGVSIHVGAGVTDPATILVVGGNNVLLDNASKAVTVWLEGTDDFGYAVMTAAPGRSTRAPSCWGPTATPRARAWRHPTDCSTRPVGE